MVSPRIGINDGLRTSVFYIRGFVNYEVLNQCQCKELSLAEQKRIVAEIEKQLAKTKELNENMIASQKAIEQLLKALLHEAFEVGR